MKIVEIIHSLNPGGAERLLVDLSNQLSTNSENEIYVLVLKNRKEKNENFYLHELSNKVHFLSMDFGDGINIKYPLLLYKAIKKIQPDIVHVHCVLHYTSLAMFLYRKCKYVVTLHNKAEMGFAGYRKTLVKFFVKKDIANIVTISHTNQVSYRNYTHLKNDTLIYNGRKQPERTSLYQETENFFSTLRQSKTTIILLCIAKCSVQKNLELLISSVNNLNKTKNTDLKLIIIGDGYNKTELGKSLLSLSSENIIFLGPKNNVADYYYLSDAFCLSSIYEGMPISLIEAVACGCITISTPVSGAIDLINNGVTGFISPDFTNDNYESTLQKFIDTRSLINPNLITNIFKSQYTIEICAKSYDNLFRTIKK